MASISPGAGDDCDLHPADRQKSRAICDPCSDGICPPVCVRDRTSPSAASPQTQSLPCSPRSCRNRLWHDLCDYSKIYV